MSGLRFLFLCPSREKPWIRCNNTVYIIIISNRKEMKPRARALGPSCGQVVSAGDGDVCLDGPSLLLPT